MFLEDTPRLMRLMHYAAAHQDGDALGQVAHALRGGASHFGLSELVGLCERLERLARVGNLGRAAELVSAVDQAFARARQPLEALRGQPGWLTLEYDAGRRVPWPRTATEPGERSAPSPQPWLYEPSVSRTPA